MTGEKQRGHVYYHCNGYNNCTSKKNYVREEILLEQIETFVDGLRFPNEELFNWLVRELKATHHAKIDYVTTSLKNIDRDYLKLQRRLDSLYEDKLDRVIIEEKYQELSVRYRGEQEQLNHQKKALLATDQKFIELGITMLEMANIAGEKFRDFSKGKKQAFLQFSLSNATMEGDELHLAFIRPLELIKQKNRSKSVFSGTEDRTRTCTPCGTCS